MTEIRAQIELLVKLQELEIEAGKIRSALAQLPGQLAQIDNGLKMSLDGVEQVRLKLETLQKRYRALESEAQTNQERIRKSQVKLASVKTNKEYQSMLKEIEDLQKIDSDLEDEMLQILDQIEVAEKAVVIQSKAAEEARQTAGLDKARIEQETASHETRLAELESNWNDLSQSVATDLLTTYNRIKTQRGTAVAAVAHAVCFGCHMNIPPQLYNELQRFDRLAHCPNCERIIYWQPQG